MRLPNKTDPELIYKANTKGPWSETRGPMIGGPGPWSCGSTVAIRHSNPLPLVHGPSKTIQLQLSPGNAIGKTWVPALLSDRAMVLGPRSTGLGKVVQEPRARFYEARWGVFCHWASLQSHPAGLKKVYSDKTQFHLTRSIFSQTICTLASNR